MKQYIYKTNSYLEHEQPLTIWENANENQNGIWVCT